MIHLSAFVPEASVITIMKYDSGERHATFIKPFRQWMRSRRYSERTIDTYTDGLRVFFDFIREGNGSEIHSGDISA